MLKLFFAAILGLAPADESVYIFGASWCGPCRNLESALKDDAGLKAEIATFRECKHFDFDNDRPLFNRYLVDRFPTVIVVNREGNQVRRMVGYTSPGPLLRFLRNER